MPTTTRQDIINIFQDAFRASRVEQVIEERIRFDGETMEVDGFRYELAKFERCVLISVGKAAEPMFSSFLTRSGRSAGRFEGVIVAPDPVTVPSEKFVAFHAGHPSPNAASIQAAEEILRVLRQLTERDLAIFLISGGGSSLVEQFLEAETPLEVIAATHKALVESGAPITAINSVRKHLSSVKGGRLAAAAAPAEQLTIAVSDVPAGRLDALSSGPTIPDESTLADVYDAVERHGLMERLPACVAAQLAAHSLAETPKRGESIFARSRWSVLLDSSSLEAAAGRRAAELGWQVVVDNTCDDWKADEAAAYLVDRLRELRRTRKRVCLLSSGEVTVAVPHGMSGSGGRNQHFVLEAARRIAGEGITVLSVGSDGVDGNSPAAGGVADGSSVARAVRAGYPVDEALAAFNSYSLLSSLEDAITTGPTGNNLRDLRVLLAP
jgi:hydroxypyruvate reductase